jgi:hypothetical protein
MSVASLVSCMCVVGMEAGYVSNATGIFSWVLMCFSSRPKQLRARQNVSLAVLWGPRSLVEHLVKL